MLVAVNQQLCPHIRHTFTLHTMGSQEAAKASSVEVSWVFTKGFRLRFYRSLPHPKVVEYVATLDSG